ncbi:MAG: Hsp70 family protein [Spirochaetia bacterium]
MPTAVYIDRGYLPTIGTAAIEKYLTLNTGRVVRLKKVEIGEITQTTAEMDRRKYGADSTIRTKVTTLVDEDIPGRLFRGMKKFLGSSAMRRFSVFEKNIKTEALLTPVYRDVYSKISAFTGTAEPSVHIGRPVRFDGEDDEANKRALRRMTNICRHSEIEAFRFYPEPVAAALSYLHFHDDHKSRRFLIFDFGGGTLDLCLVFRDGGGFTVEGTAGLPIAGDKIDQLIYRKKIFPEIGEGAVLAVNGGEEYHFPFDEFADHLLNWQSTSFLNQPRFLDMIKLGIKYGGETKKKVTRLFSIIRQNASYQVLKTIEEAKIELSGKDRTEISLPELDLQIGLTKREFGEILTPIVTRIGETISSLLDEMEITPGEVDKVICTGGSSQIPAIQDYLQKHFRGQVKNYDNFTGTASGLAVANYCGYTFSDVHRSNLTP